ncbi:ABC transporter ATP-binding protein [Cognatishimia sp. F0-27]|uniref:ABC transporter ATP-binding protein n=1 Tax=Cognatishimia sp. F0-27 TaxID=2816855 RepID=UPI001D0C9E83|nr:ABC transporter ATP-binding protein [Cognatishimia sp. F0-27]MCC1491331.1 ABC transporter ATP-binding protein [Cognatishimia sp. F0-27]
MLEIRDLSVAYGKHQALEGATLRVNPGEIVVILGANGAGKSTLLKAVSGICEGKVRGSVTLDGHQLDSLPADRIVEEGIALVPEGRGIFGDLTVEENLKLGAYPERAKGDEQANLDRVFALFPKLIERRRQVARTMSGGEQQMVAIGRAMMSSPQILTLDEPSLGLSPLLCKELFQNLKQVRALGIGILMVEQNAKQSLAIADRGYLLENTRIVHEGEAKALMTDPAVQAAYLGGGGAAAPATHSPPPSSEKETLTKVTVRPPSRRRQSADVLVGMDLSDLVAKAGETAKSAPKVKAAPMAAAEARQDDIKAMLKEFEIAAARAGQSRPLPDYTPVARSASPAAPAASASTGSSDDAPVTIEVYRAPRVEVYRRRTNGDFERD